MPEEELKWDTTLENSKEQSTKFTNEPLNEHKRGRTQKNDW
jgi:hypothetical protein